MLRLGLAAATILAFALNPTGPAFSQNTRATVEYARIKQKLDAVPAIDTHDHLWPFDKLPGYKETKADRGMNLAGVWHNSYYRWFNPLTAW